MTPRLHLRAAGWRDLASMARLESRCFPHDAWSEPTFWAELAARPARSYWVATPVPAAPLVEGCPQQRPVHEQVLGYAGLSSDGEVADVMTLAVDPSLRGRGWGVRLLGRLHETARADGCRTMMLEVRADNVPARRLYTATGYRQVHVRRGYYRPSDGAAPVDALVLRKELTAS